MTDSSWSTDTQSPGLVIVRELDAELGVALVLQGFLVALPNRHVVHNGTRQCARRLGRIPI